MNRYDEIEEITIVKTFDEVLKFNPYHDSRGRFSNGNSLGSFAPLHGKTTNGERLLAMYRENHGGKDGGDAGAGKPAAFGNTAQQKGHKEGTYLDKGDFVNGETIDKVAKDLGVRREDARDMCDAITSWCADSSDIRDASRGGITDPFVVKQLNDLESFIKESPKWAGGELHRGLEPSEKRYNEILANAQQGKPIDLGGPSSWSSDLSTARTFAHANWQTGEGGSTSIILHSNGTSTSHGTSIQHLSGFGSAEAEVLMSRETIFTPTRMEKVNGVVHIYGDMP